MLAEIPDWEQLRLLEAMQTIEQLLTPDFKYSEPFILRSHAPGDIGWIINKHGMLYSREYGWDERFEAAVSQIADDFIHNYKPKKEHCWIAEMSGENVGSIVLAQENDTTAKIGLLIVDPKARGVGLGSRLVEEAIRFARRAGYQKIVLWTNHVLIAARNIYRNKGFQLVYEEEHSNFGPKLTGETWELQL
ncbi:GNAT family N-acetyltransferase [Paenibacillus fonticola]|uniref:GNAT family N-acetyltransferase n=1 Tax=Paenibacillus fonticola TaxID=379896 RepID=UPI000376DB1C|nr:GNAT family N-acetyltransferase [Paenibacillus fonticola]